MNLRRLTELLTSPDSARTLDRTLPWLFLCFALPVMFWVALAVPPGQSPDEAAQIARAASVLHPQIAGHRGGMVQVQDHQEPSLTLTANFAPVKLALTPSNPPPYYGWVLRKALQSAPWDHGATQVDAPNTAVYPPFLFLPAGLALAYAHVFQQTPFDAVLDARITDAVCYALLGMLALLLARRGKILLFLLLCLPTALWLGGTVHQDGLMIGLTILAVALLTDAEHSHARLWAAAVALALVILARPPLLPLALLIAVPVGLRSSWRPLLLAALPGLLWTLLVVPHVAVPFYIGPPTHGGPLWEGDPTRIFPLADPDSQAHILLSHPGLLITLPIATLMNDWSVRLSEIFKIVGALNVALPDFIEALGIIALLAALAALGREAPLSRLKPIAALLAAALILIYAAQYLSWTHVGAAQVDGVQGRYFLELLPFLALAGAPRPGRPLLALPAIALGAAGLIVVPWTIVQTYYMYSGR
jgi:hypothetical protein